MKIVYDMSSVATEAIITLPLYLFVDNYHFVPANTVYIQKIRNYLSLVSNDLKIYEDDVKIENSNWQICDGKISAEELFEQYQKTDVLVVNSVVEEQFPELLYFISKETIIFVMEETPELIFLNTIGANIHMFSEIIENDNELNMKNIMTFEKARYTKNIEKLHHTYSIEYIEAGWKKFFDGLVDCNER